MILLIGGLIEELRCHRLGLNASAELPFKEALKRMNAVNPEADLDQALFLFFDKKISIGKYMQHIGYVKLNTGRYSEAEQNFYGRRLRFMIGFRLRTLTM